MGMMEGGRKKIMAWVCTGKLRTGGPLRYACDEGLRVSGLVVLSST